MGLQIQLAVAFCPLQQVRDRLTGLGSTFEPLLDFLTLKLDPTGSDARIVSSHLLYDSSISRRARVADDDPVKWSLFFPQAGQSNFDAHGSFPFS